MYKKDLALNNLQWLVCHKNKPNHWRKRLVLDLDKQRQTCIYKNIILYFYSSMVTLMWSRRAVRESLHTQKSCWESEQTEETELQPKFLTL